MSAATRRKEVLAKRLENRQSRIMSGFGATFARVQTTLLTRYSTTGPGWSRPSPTKTVRLTQA